MLFSELSNFYKDDTSDMAKNMRKIRPPISNSIDLINTWQVVKWCVELKCSYEKLQLAVEKVGSSADAVRDYLRRGA